MYSAEPIRPGDTVLLGDSLTEGFDVKRYFAGRPVKNRGISGDTASHLKYRLEEITGTCAAKIFVMIGINDLFSGAEPETITREITGILTDITGHCKNSTVYLQSLLPVYEGSYLIFNDINLLIYKTNDLLRRSCRESGVTFLDLHRHFLGESGQMAGEFTFDGVHLTSRAYQLWARLIDELV